FAKLTSVSGEEFPIQGNPDLNPQVSVNYEVGAKSQVTPRAAVNVTFFVKDVYDYPRAIPIVRAEGLKQAITYSQYISGSYARSKGFEVEVEKRRSHNWAGKVTYTYSQTKGKDSDPGAIRALQLANAGTAEVPIAEQFVTWNRPHKLTASLDVRFDDQAPRAWLKQTGVNVFLQG